MTWLLVTRYPLVAQLWRFWASFPGIHIAQFPFQVIGNCGVISLMHCSNHQGSKHFGEPERRAETIKVWMIFLKQGRRVRRELQPELAVGQVQNMTVSWRWRLASVSSATRGSVR